MRKRILSLFSGAREARERHLAFARSHFGGCRTHVEEAAAVHRVIELLLWHGHVNVTQDLSLAEMFDGVQPGPPINDSLDTIEYVMTLEEEMCSEWSEGMSWESAVRRLLLGPEAARSTWAAETLPSRSIRGIVEERVRLRGDCSCGHMAV